METIHLPDNQEFPIQFNENEPPTAKEVIAKICQEQYEIENPSDYGIFSLFIICQYQNEGDEHETKLQLPLKPDHKLNHVKASIQKIHHFKQELKIHFKFGRTALYPVAKEEKIKDEKVLKILYLEAKNNVFDKLYPLSSEQKLRALKIDNLINAFNNSETIEDDLQKKYHSLSNENKLRKRIDSFKLSNSMKRKKNPQNLDENERTRSDEIELKKLYQDYLQICRELPCYGGMFFEGQMERTIKEFIIHGRVYDKKVAVAINDNGIHVIHRECPKILLTLGFKNLDYEILYAKNREQEHNCLIIKEHNDDDQDQDQKPTRKVFTRQASFIDQTLKSFVKNHRRESVI